VATDITKGIKSIPVGGRKWPITTLDNNITVKRLNSAMGVNFMYPSNLFQVAITIGPQKRGYLRDSQH
jgi:hypothetical protein